MFIATALLSWAAVAQAYEAFPLTFNATSLGCTTLNPIFGFPADGTSTVFATTEISTTTENCRGCTPYTQTFAFVITTPAPSPTTTITNPLTISTVYECAPPTTPGPTISTTPASVATPTASAVPPISNKAQTFIDAIRTAIVYASLLANGPFPDVLCTGLNPTVLSNNTGYNGTAILSEVCFAADVEQVAPDLYPAVVVGNQIALQYLEQALFAVQIVGGYAGVDAATPANVQKLCDEIEADLLNGIFTGFLVNEGDKIKKYVCGAVGA